MPRFRTGIVTELLSERRGLQRVTVDGEPAYVLTELIGSVAVGDRVVINTTAVDLGLGTGGWHVVHWNLSREAWDGPGGGHVLKLRYTSLQADTGVAEESHPDLPSTIEAIPVVAISVHSQLAPVAAAFADRAPGCRLVYVMTDGGALPLALSDIVAALTTAGLLAGTVTAGHAFGGDLEAVDVPSALVLAATELRADCIVAGTNLGVVGTGSTLGTSAVEVAPILDSAAALGGTPILCARASTADQRPRHRGLSHHTSTVLDLVRSPVRIAVPPGIDIEYPGAVTITPPDAGALLSAHGIRATTMGRTPAEDPLFFAAAAAAGALAADLARARAR